MKQHAMIERKTKSQNRQVIQNASSGQFLSSKWIPSKSAMTHSPLRMEGLGEDLTSS